MYCISNYYKPDKQGVFAAKDCNEFVKRIVKDFEEAHHIKASLVIVPDDYTGDLNGKGYKIVGGGKPKCHYYITL
jgi:hypothetical protein